ncbi:hypothetical protein VNO77_01491 [Canavalia gladiata]|uniref:Uncharacterized protein n=1 Tax=Canavalia gladiata TaxID=3824 RepID=A0AAN9MR85_CANGL
MPTNSGSHLTNDSNHFLKRAFFFMDWEAVFCSGLLYVHDSLRNGDECQKNKTKLQLIFKQTFNNCQTQNPKHRVSTTIL